jgi:hypothetical protein
MIDNFDCNCFRNSGFSQHTNAEEASQQKAQLLVAGYHCLFEIRVGGEAVDPLSYLNLEKKMEEILGR